MNRFTNHSKRFHSAGQSQSYGGLLCMLALFLISHLSFGQRSINPDNDEEYSGIADQQIRDLLFEVDKYYFSNPNKTIELGNKVIDRAMAIGFMEGEIIGRNIVGESYRFLGDYPQTLSLQFRALELSQVTKNLRREAISLGFIGIAHLDMSEFRVALDYLLQAKLIYDQLQPRLTAYDPFNLSNIGEAYQGLEQLDSAKAVATRALNIALQNGHSILTILCIRRLGYVQNLSGNRTEAIKLYHEAIRRINVHADSVNYSQARNQLAEIYRTEGNIDSSIYYSRQALNHAVSISQYPEILNAAKLLGILLRTKKMPDSVIYYQDLAFKMQDRLYGPERIRAVSLIAMREYQRQQRILAERENYQTRIKQILMLTGLLMFLAVSVILYRRSKQRHKANMLLEEKNKKIEDSMSALKATQAQLIHSEKMASLGELTAGIAHEIQNPLNFVNNFSQVNTELVDEAKLEMDKGNADEAKAILNDIKDNAQKINHHGKRADAIVKGMLQHSRTSSGQNEPTDINALADEYLRLAYHGFRAKEKSFNSQLKTSFDPAVGRINVVPQEIGRVLLNLINNAFYAVHEKKKKSGDSYQPIVSVSSLRNDGKVEIRVSDNGDGIPEKIRDKIFQPFFTTKPTGEGTGLGLSLAYDIVTKGHGGDLTVDTKEGMGSEFLVAFSNT